MMITKGMAIQEKIYMQILLFLAFFYNVNND